MAYVTDYSQREALYHHRLSKMKKETQYVIKLYCRMILGVKGTLSISLSLSLKLVFLGPYPEEKEKETCTNVCFNGTASFLEPCFASSLINRAVYDD